MSLHPVLVACVGGENVATAMAFDLDDVEQGLIGAAEEPGRHLGDARDAGHRVRSLHRIQRGGALDEHPTNSRALAIFANSKALDLCLIIEPLTHRLTRVAARRL